MVRCAFEGDPSELLCGEESGEVSTQLRGQERARAPQTWVYLTSATRWNALDTIPGEFKITSWQLWGQAHQRPQSPSSPGPLLLLLGKDVFAGVAVGVRNGF